MYRVVKKERDVTIKMMDMYSSPAVVQTIRPAPADLVQRDHDERHLLACHNKMSTN